ncbi:MAG: GNAT family N-acetyltransferase [Nodosilinea sp.]
MEQPLISLATPDQFPALVTLFEAQLLEHGIHSSVDALMDTCQLIHNHSEYGFILVATRDGLIVGVAYASSVLSLEHGGWSGWLDELYVLPEWRGHGIGTRLLDAVITGAIERGWIALDLEVDIGHQRAVSLYASRGFQPVHRSRLVRNLYDEPEA